MKCFKVQSQVKQPETGLQWTERNELQKFSSFIFEPLDIEVIAIKYIYQENIMLYIDNYIFFVGLNCCELKNKLCS